MRRAGPQTLREEGRAHGSRQRARKTTGYPGFPPARSGAVARESGRVGRAAWGQERRLHPRSRQLRARSDKSALSDDENGGVKEGMRPGNFRSDLYPFAATQYRIIIMELRNIFKTPYQLPAGMRLYYNRKVAKVAELVDAPDLGSGAARRGGSSPSFRTTGAAGGADGGWSHRIQLPPRCHRNNPKTRECKLTWKH